MKRTTSVAAVVLFLMLGCVAPAANAFTPVVPDGSFGVSNLALLNKMNSAQRVPLLQRLKSAGIDAVRADAAWFDLEPLAPVGGAHTYYWNQSYWNDGYVLEPFVTDLAANGIRWQPVLDNAPTWVDGCGMGGIPPTHWSDFSAFVTALAQRYGSNGSFWKANPNLPYLPVTTYEIWNEENAGCPTNPWTPATYDSVFQAARNAIKAVDPNAKVIVGGLTDHNQIADTWAAEMVAASPSITNEIDGWGLHPYYQTASGFVSEPENKVVMFRKELHSLAVPDSEPIDVTEIGWTTEGSTAGGYVDIPDSGAQPDRADALVQTSDQLMRSNCNVAQYFVHTWWSPETDPMAQEDWFGIVNHDATLKPSAQAWSNEVNLLYGNGPTAPPSGTVQLC
jgi:hypothetical protein